MANNTSSKSVLALVGLALLYVVLVFLSEFIGFINPWCWILYSALAAILAAWPVFKAIEKTGGKFIFLLFGVLFILTYFLEFGWNTLPSTVFSLVFVIAAELLHRILGYGSKKALSIAYPVFAFVPLGNIFSLWTNTARYAQSAAEDVGQAYGEQISHMGNVGTLAVAAVAIIVLALLAAKLFYKEK